MLKRSGCITWQRIISNVHETTRIHMNACIYGMHRLKIYVNLSVYVTISYNLDGKIANLSVYTLKSLLTEYK